MSMSMSSVHCCTRIAEGHCEYFHGVSTRPQWNQELHGNILCIRVPISAETDGTLASAFIQKAVFALVHRPDLFRFCWCRMDVLDELLIILLSPNCQQKNSQIARESLYCD